MSMDAYLFESCGKRRFLKTGQSYKTNIIYARSTCCISYGKHHDADTPVATEVPPRQEPQPQNGGRDDVWRINGREASTQPRIAD